VPRRGRRKPSQSRDHREYPDERVEDRYRQARSGKERRRLTVFDSGNQREDCGKKKLYPAAVGRNVRTITGSPLNLV